MHPPMIIRANSILDIVSIFPSCCKYSEFLPKEGAAFPCSNLYQSEVHLSAGAKLANLFSLPYRCLLALQNILH